VVRREDDWLERIGVDVRVGYLSDTGDWFDVFAGVRYVIHCAGDAVYGNGPTYYRDNVELTRNLLTAVRKHSPGLRRFVFVSTIGAIDREATDPCFALLDENAPPAPTSDYGRTKLEAEKLVRDSGIPFSIVRPAMVVGDDMRSNSHFSVFARYALRDHLFARIRWPGALSVVHIDDLADALILCAEHPDADGGTFFCAGEPVSVGEFFEYCKPDAWRISVSWLLGLLRTFRRFIPFGVKALMFPVLVADDSALRRLGWLPRFSWREALAGVVHREKWRIDPWADPMGQSVITGAASGLGRALVDQLAPIRTRLLLIDRNRQGLEELKARYPHCRILVKDLSDEDSIASVIDSTEWNELQVAELFSCAGIGARGNILDMSIERQLDMFKVNVMVRFALAHAAMRQMARRYCGRLVFISSSSAFQPLPYMAVYAASNAAILLFGEACAAEVAEKGISVLTVCPGGMKTNFQRSAAVKELAGEKLMSPEEVAQAILKAIAKGKMTIIVSTRALAMSLLARLLPRSASVRLWRYLMEKMR
jgi:short-subunit dehydrogenase